MSDEDPTSVIRVLKSFRQSTENRNNVPPLRMSTSGITPPLSMSLLNDSKLGSSSSSSLRKKSPSDNYTLNDTKNLTARSRQDYTEATPPKRQRLDSTNASNLNLSGTTNEIPTSPWEWRRLKAENLSLRTRLSHQEAAVEKLHQIRREIEQLFAKDKSNFETEIELGKSTIEQLQRRLEASRKNTQEAQEALSLSQNELYQVKTKMEHEIKELMEENSRLIEDLRHLRDAQDSPASPKPSDDGETEELELKLEAAEDRIIELEEKLREHLTSEQEFELQAIELQNAKLKIEHLEAERGVWEEGKALTSRAARANELEKELNHAHETIALMRESVKGKLLLEEQMTNLKQRIEHTENVERQVALLDVQKNELLNKLAEYESIGIGGGPGDLKREIHRLQQAEAISKLEEGQLRSKVDSLQREYQQLQDKFNKTEKIANEMTISSNKWSQLVGRLQKKMLLVTRERDSYRAQLDLYEKEMSTVDSNNAITERIPALERSLEDYRKLVDQLEMDLTAAIDTEAVGSMEECVKLREEVKKLRGELEHRALKGDFNCNARILHFKMNPAEIAGQLAEEKQKALLQEVEELRAMVQVGNTSGVTSGSSVHAQEIADLKQTHEIKIARLKDAFKLSSQEYRQACYQLFGWRVDRTKEGRYKLSSQYAESPDDFLFFQVGEGVDLLETAFSATLGELVERHLQIQHSVPMFLGAVQAELFSEQTMTAIMP